MIDLVLEHPEQSVLCALLLLALAAVVLLALLVRREPSRQLQAVRRSLAELAERLDRFDGTLHAESARSRQEASLAARQAREESHASAARQTEALLGRLGETARSQKDQLDSFARQLANLTGLNETKLESLRGTMEERLRGMQADTGVQLERMRRVVDDTLQSTLEKRLGDSFKQVSERLEQVYAGLGEMRTLASGVGDLKKVLTNVKTRGTWGEIRLAPDPGPDPDPRAVRRQRGHPAGRNRAGGIRHPPAGAGRVAEGGRLAADRRQVPAGGLPAAARRPGGGRQGGRPTAAAQPRASASRPRPGPSATSTSNRRTPPTSRILFLPVEGLYAEVLRIPGLCDTCSANTASWSPAPPRWRRC